MQGLLKQLLSELNSAYFKPNGFKKERHRFRRNANTAVQEVEFQSSQWNSTGEAITFYVNISIGFTDIPIKDDKPALTGRGRIAGFVSDAPEQFDLTPINFGSIRDELLAILPKALSELPKHYEDVRSRARTGLHTPIPLPATWRT